MSAPCRSMLVSLGVVIAVGACDAEPFVPSAPSFSAHAAGPSFTDWSSPVHLGSVVNSDAVDIEVSISRDGRSLYFSSNRAGGMGGFDIWVSRRRHRGDPWGTPENLGPTINTAANEQGPSLTVDGHRLYFFSNRAGGFGGNDIHVASRRGRRDDHGWTTPQNLGSGVNTASNDNLPHFVVRDGRGIGTLYFNSNRPGGLGGTDIYASELLRDGTFAPAAHVPELSSPGQDAGLAVRRDGLEAILASNRVGTLGDFDLWATSRATPDAAWSVPTNLGSVVNSPSGESRLALSWDAKTLYVVSDRTGGLGSLDIWLTTRSRAEMGH